MTIPDYEFTENSAKHAVAGLLAGAETSAIIAEGKAAGKTMDEVGADVFAQMPQDEIKDLGKVMLVVNLLVRMGEAFQLGDIHEQTDHRDDESGMLRNHAFLGYMAIVQHYVDSSAAKRWDEFYNAAETIGDVYRYFLAENALNLEDYVYPTPTHDIYAYPILGYDVSFVKELLTVRLDRQEIVEFAINQEAMDKLIAKN